MSSSEGSNNKQGATTSTVLAAVATEAAGKVNTETQQEVIAETAGVPTNVTQKTNEIETQIDAQLADLKTSHIKIDFNNDTKIRTSTDKCGDDTKILNGELVNNSVETPILIDTQILNDLVVSPEQPPAFDSSELLETSDRFASFEPSDQFDISEPSELEGEIGSNYLHRSENQENDLVNSYQDLQGSTKRQGEEGVHRESDSRLSNPHEQRATYQHLYPTPTIVNADTASSSSSNSSLSSEMKRSAVKDLIERYFYQLQRGCGNISCRNVNCASSGLVAPMTANEIAAKAIQLFSQDAELCDTYNQPPKLLRTHVEEPSCSGSALTSSHDDTDMLSPEENSNASSSSSAPSTITSDNSNSGRSATIATPTSTNTNISSCYTEEAALIGLPAMNLEAPKPSTADTEKKDTCGTLYPKYVVRSVDYLNEEIIDSLIEDCERSNNYVSLTNAINEVFWSIDKLSASFMRNPNATHKDAKLHELLDKPLSDLKKEDIRTLQGETDKDIDSTCPSLVNEPDADDDTSMEDDFSFDLSTLKGSESMVDFASLRRVKKKLLSLKNCNITDDLNSNIFSLAESVQNRTTNDWEPIIHCLTICFAMVINGPNTFVDMEYLERSLSKLCYAMRNIPISAQARIARIWAVHCKDQLQYLIQSLQQLITLEVILDEDNIQDNNDVIAVTKVLKVVFYANILAGEMEPPPNPLLSDDKAAIKPSDINDTTGDGGTSSSSTMQTSNSQDEDDYFIYSHTPRPQYLRFTEDALERELNISIYDCRVPLVPFADFYNELLSEAIQMDRDYFNYKNLSVLPNDMSDAHFSFMLYSFILTPASKVIALYYDSRIRMYSERSSSFYNLLNFYGENAPEADGRLDLKLKVRRDQLINDALIGLELVAMSTPKDFKKQLVVEFVGEQGIDEGGVSKEFFQLIVEEIFNPDFGMFIQQEETNNVWFNTSTFENEAQFTLIGIIIGLAIYNNVILAVNFPMVVYRKLMGCTGTFFDLENWNPTLYRSLKSMLDYTEDDFEDVFMATFKISYKDMFGEIVEHELLPDGGNIPVTQLNKRRFVDLYSDFLLNKSIERQFSAFKKGFEMVTDESPLKLLFRPEEIELLICGSRKFDFYELEKSTEYEGGYCRDSDVIQYFWEVVHGLPEESKRKLLEFTTGSDRVPVGGLSRLKLLITRHGPDSDRLPTSHTCYNVLLLPDYNSKEKLEERLLKAINYSKGFGML